MSLKGFHIIFILLATTCTLGFAVWTVVNGAGVAILIWGAISALLGVGLLVYGIWFYLTKLKDSRF